MNKKMMITTFGLSIMFLSVLGGNALTGDTSTSNTGSMQVAVTLADIDTTVTSTCLDLKSVNLRYRSNDAKTDGEVTVLQDFLQSVSLLKSQATGFFGLGTFAAVKQFQKMSGLSPTGYVGLLTKAKIKEQSCNGTQMGAGDNSSNNGTHGDGTLKNNPVKHGQVIRCTQEMKMCPDGKNMPRDHYTCAWKERECGKVRTGSSSEQEINPYNTWSPKPLQGNGMMTPNPGTGSSSEQEINPQNTWSSKRTPIKGILAPVACTMETRMCPDGGMMSRNVYNCEWIESSCTNLTPPMHGNVKGVTDQVIDRSQGSTSPTICTMEVRYCSNGSVMPRDMNTCNWLQDRCSTTPSTNGIHCTTDPFSGRPFCGPVTSMPSSI